MSDPLADHLAKVTPAVRQRDAHTLIELMTRVTSQEPALWGTIIGFGSYHYRYDNGREGDTAAVAFAPRKAATTIYLVDGVVAHADLLPRLGPHKTGVGCLYVTNLDQVDLGVLEEIVTRSYATVTKMTYTKRARDGTPPTDR